MAFNQFTPSPSTVFFIDPVYIKQNCAINANIDDKLILQSIKYAQDLFVMCILGSTLYKQLEAEISGGTISADTNGTYLINNFIQPCLAAATMVRLLPIISFQFKNKGVMTQKSEFSEPAQRKDIEWMMEQYQSVAQFYAQRTTQFLAANTDVFLTYLNPALDQIGNGADLYIANSSSYNGGIFLPNLVGDSSFQEYKGWGLSIEDLIQMKGLQ